MVRPPAVDATARGELVHEWADITSEGGAEIRLGLAEAAIGFRLILINEISLTPPLMMSVCPPDPTLSLLFR